MIAALPIVTSFSGLTSMRDSPTVSVPAPNTSTLIFCTTLPVPRAESSSAPLLTSVAPSPMVTRATSASVRILA